MAQGKRPIRINDIVAANYSKKSSYGETIIKGETYMVNRIHTKLKGRIKIKGQDGYWRSSNFKRIIKEEANAGITSNINVTSSIHVLSPDSTR